MSNRRASALAFAALLPLLPAPALAGGLAPLPAQSADPPPPSPSPLPAPSCQPRTPAPTS